MSDQSRRGHALVYAVGVEDQLAEGHAIVGADADMCSRNEEDDRLSLVCSADIDMTELTQKTQGDGACRVDHVAADAVMNSRARLRWGSLEARIEGLEGGAALEGAVRALLVVAVAEEIELKLEMGDGLSRCLAGEEDLEGLVKAFDFAAGLGMVWG
jgi:hypothetical protein